jgi:hypothetical protein
MNSCVTVSSRVAISGKRHRLQARREHHAGYIRNATSGAVQLCGHAASFEHVLMGQRESRMTADAGIKRPDGRAALADLHGGEESTQ